MWPLQVKLNFLVAPQGIYLVLLVLELFGQLILLGGGNVAAAFTIALVAALAW